MGCRCGAVADVLFWRGSQESYQTREGSEDLRLSTTAPNRIGLTQAPIGAKYLRDAAPAGVPFLMAQNALIRYSFDMKVVIATPFYPPERGVLGVYAAGLAGAFEKRGDTVVVVPFADTRHLPPGLRHLAYFSRILTAAPGASFVLGLDTWSVGLPALLAAKIRRVPYVVRIGGDFLWESYIERTHSTVRLSEFYTQPRAYSLKEHFIFHATRWLLRRANVVFFNTKFQKRIWEDAYGFPSGKSHVLENYYPPVTMYPAEARVFVSGNRSSLYKNVERLDLAFEQVRRKYPAATLDTRLLLHDEHLARNKNAYAVIVPSISEVSSNNVIDGVSCGKPFVMTDDTGTSERLQDCGIFVDTRSEEKLGEAIESLLDQTTYDRLAQNIRNFSFTHSWDEIVTEIREKL